LNRKKIEVPKKQPGIFEDFSSESRLFRFLFPFFQNFSPATSFSEFLFIETDFETDSKDTGIGTDSIYAGIGTDSIDLIVVSSPLI